MAVAELLGYSLGYRWFVLVLALGAVGWILGCHGVVGLKLVHNLPELFFGVMAVRSQSLAPPIFMSAVNPDPYCGNNQPARRTKS